MNMSEHFETLGNASLQIFQDGRPVLATDPWLIGTCYFGSWALDHKLTDEQIGNVIGSDFIWISHGHPDHLHHESLALLPRGKKILVADHYSDEIKKSLSESGFDVTVLPYHQWFPITSRIRVMCLDNINQDAILVIEAGDSLVINLNDSPIAEEFPFLRRLVRRYPPDKTYLAALCSVDADMFNLVDAEGRSLVEPPEQRKPGAIWSVARMADRLGVKNFCCSSSQHIYVRADSIWANPHRITWADMQQHWSRPNVNLIEPFVTIDLSTGAITKNHPSQQSDISQITDRTGADDWSARLSPEEWQSVENFFRRFALIRRHIDFIEVEVAGESRRFELVSPPRRRADRQRGLCFQVPKKSLLEVVEWGYFDDLLIGNFMRTRVVNTHLYPRFSPLVAKVGGNAKVYTRAAYMKFLWRYFRRNPRGTAAYMLKREMSHVVMPGLRRWANRLGVMAPAKLLYRSILGDPAVLAVPGGPQRPLAPGPGAVDRSDRD
jgi:hypothetical protein